MKKHLLIALAVLSSLTVYGAATRYITADQIKSSDLTKTWSFPSTTDTMVGRAASESISGTKNFTSAVQIPNGSVTVPGIYTSTGSGNTGFYFGANGGAFGYNGTEVTSFATTLWKHNTQVQWAFAGSANTPNVFLESDTHAGFYRIGTNNWGWSANSAKVLDMSTSGLGVTGTLNVSGTTTLNSALNGIAQFVSGVLSASGLTGDVTTSGSVTTIANSAVTNAKMANMSNGSVKSNISGSTGAPSDNSVTAILDSVFSSTQGSILYRAASAWLALPPGVSGSVFTSGSTGANPYWGASSGGGSGTFSEYRLTDFSLASGWGSTDTSVFKFSGSAVTEVNTGSGLTYANTSTNGMSITVVAGHTGECSFSAWAGRNNADNIGLIISKNADATARSTNVDSWTSTQGPYLLTKTTASGSVARGTYQSVSWSGPCTGNDVFRMHGLNGVSHDTGGFAFTLRE